MKTQSFTANIGGKTKSWMKAGLLTGESTQSQKSEDKKDNNNQANDIDDLVHAKLSFEWHLGYRSPSDSPNAFSAD